jgi:restriction system protein
MPIPTFDQMLHPVLVLAAKQNITRRDEREQRISSGASTYVENRSGWAMTFLTKAHLIEKVRAKTYHVTDDGRAFLTRHPNGFTVKDLEAIDGWEEAWRSSRRSKNEAAVTPSETTTPLEMIYESITTLNSALKDRLLASVLEQSPLFFEKLVLDVLLKMGYGGSRADAAEHLGKSGDEGIDGCIKQDPLGLDQILVQAKRYARDRPIDRKTIQAFVGSMTGRGVTKGIFITTSTFNENAREFVQRGSQTKVILTDGDELLTLMLRHHVGVVPAERQVEVLELDQNYVGDEE